MKFYISRKYFVLVFLDTVSTFSFSTSYFSSYCHRTTTSRRCPNIRQHVCFLNSKDFEFSTCIGKGSYVDVQGNPKSCLTFSTSLLVEGTLMGNVFCTSSSGLTTDQEVVESSDKTMIFVEQGGLLQSNTSVHTMVVHGEVRGSIQCSKLIIGSTGYVIGDIQCSSLQVEDGATILGAMDCRKYDTALLVHNKESSEDSDQQNQRNGSMNSSSDAKDATKRGYYTTQLPMTVSVNGKVLPTPHTDSGTSDNARGTQKDPLKQVHDKNLGEPSNPMLSKFKDSKKHDRNMHNYVDNFGNPLHRGANHQQISSFRHYRELSKETRSLLDLHHRNRLKSSSDDDEALLFTSESTDEKLLLQRSNINDDTLVDSDDGYGINIIPPFLR